MATNNKINRASGTNGIITSPFPAVNMIITTKGDLVVGSGTNTSARLPIEDDGLVLTANPTKPYGVDWEPSGIGTWNTTSYGYGGLTGTTLLHESSSISGTATTQILTADRLVLMPFHISTSWRFLSIGMNCTALVNPSTVRLGIYLADGTGGFPKTLFLDAGTINTSTTGEKRITISERLFGNYWMCYVSTSTPTMRANTHDRVVMNQFVGSPDLSTTQSSNLYGLIVNSVGSYASALPADISADTFVATDILAQAPLIFLGLT
jgi:hypothetical protein